MWRRSSQSADSKSAERGRPALHDLAPAEPTFTPYDEGHMATYLALLVAESKRLVTAEIGRAILGIDAEREPARFETVWQSHLERARWLAENGWSLLQDVSSSDAERDTFL